MRNASTIQIRQACPDDASFLAKATLIAGRAHVNKGIWEVILGGTEKECLDFLGHISITTIPHLFHYSCYFIAEYAEDGPVGSLGGYDPKTLGYQALQLALHEVITKLNLPVQAFHKELKRKEERGQVLNVDMLLMRLIMPRRKGGHICIINNADAHNLINYHSSCDNLTAEFGR